MERNASNAFYEEESWRPCTIAGLLNCAAHYFKRAKKIKEFERYQAILSRPPLSIGAEILDFSDDILLDHIKFSICFENYMKAILVEQHFIIHDIHKRFSRLRNEQRDRPIAEDELRALLQDQSEIIQNLRVNTIGFRSLCRHAYQAIIRLPADILMLAKFSYSERSGLHCLLGGGEVFVPAKRLEEIHAMIRFVNDHVICKLNNMIHLGQAKPGLRLDPITVSGMCVSHNEPDHRLENS